MSFHVRNDVVNSFLSYVSAQVNHLPGYYSHTIYFIELCNYTKKRFDLTEIEYFKALSYYFEKGYNSQIKERVLENVPVIDNRNPKAQAS
jgi:hypothetical protein